MPGTKVHGLTLIELLLVVLIVATLSVLTIPSAIEARTRAKVTHTKANLRQIEMGMTVYYGEHHRFPIGRTTPGFDRLGIFSISALADLTTPVAYVQTSSLRNPFGPLKPSDTALPGSSLPDRPFPQSFQSNSLLYFNYEILSLVRRNPQLSVKAYAVVSTGPDQVDSYSIYRPFPAALPNSAALYGILHVNDTIYDPTNGAVSSGDISIWGGMLPSMAGPN